MKRKKRKGDDEMDQMNTLEKLNSIEKSLNILTTIGESDQGLTIANIVKLTGLNRSAVNRSIKPLEDASFIVRDSFGLYHLGPVLFYLGQSYLNKNTNKEETLTILNEISNIVAESVGLAIRDGNQVISLYEIETSQPLKTNYTSGQFYPMNRGCYGKCLMAFYDQDIIEDLLDKQDFEKICENTLVEKEEILAEYAKIREEQFVVSINETFSYIAAVGVPIKNCRGQVTACLSISFFKNDDYMDKIEYYRSLLPKYAIQLSPYIL